MQGLNEFAEASSVHGIKYILSQNRIKSTRIFWTIAIFFSACGLGYYVYTGYHKFVYDPEIVMKTRDRPATDFPAPAITICSNLFAKDKLANLSYVYSNLNSKINLKKKNCDYLTANLHWCQPAFASMMMAYLCPDWFDHVNILKLINDSAFSIREMFFTCNDPRPECDKNYMRIFTDFGICYVRNSMSFSSIFNTDVIHDDFKCYQNMTKKGGLKTLVEDNSMWSPEKGYQLPHGVLAYPWRAERELVFVSQPIINVNDKENICALKNFRVYFHKPNEILTPLHESTYLNFDEVRNCGSLVLNTLTFQFFSTWSFEFFPKVIELMKHFEDLIQISESATLKAKDNSSFSSPTQRLTASGNAEPMLHYTNVVVSNFPCLATKQQKFVKHRNCDAFWN
jgi:Amiloride-sensitive sodium channel